MTVWQSLVLGVVEGLTEFLPISSTGHLTIAEKLLGLSIEDRSVTGFTAVIQVGAIAAVLVYFRRDLWRLLVAWWRGLRRRQARAERDYQFAWYVILGSIPIGVVGFLGQSLIEGPLRNLWVVAAALGGWSVVMYAAERVGAQDRGEADLRLRDVLVIGLWQSLALVPGVSRSGATISAGLFRGVDRVTATRLSFFLAIPALVAAGLFLLGDAVSGNVGLLPTALGTAVSFLVAYGSIAWLLRFVAHHPITFFVGYRVALALLLVILLATETISPT